MAAIDALSRQQEPKPPRRNGFAYIPAIFVPNLGLGGGSAIFSIAVIGILAAIAIPAYQDYTIRAQVSAAIDTSTPIQELVYNYAVDNPDWPNSDEDLGIEPLFVEFENVSYRITVGEGGVVYIQFVEGRLSGGSVAFGPYVENEMLYWSCQGINILPKYLPQSCR